MDLSVRQEKINSISTHPVVAVIKCPSYDQILVEQAVARGIELVGGTAGLAKKGERLLFKPNVLWGTPPEKCVITHPSVLRAAVSAFCPTGAILHYGDSPAGLSQAKPTMKKCHYDRALVGLPVKLVSFNKSIRVSYPEGRMSKYLTIAQPVLDANGIINLPKLKTHGLTRMTGAVKNCFGCVPLLVKGEFHARFPNIYDFSRAIADIASYVKPRLHIMDAIDAMEGNGPQSGKPKKLGVLLVATDPVALDVVACKLIGLDPTYVPTVAAAAEIGLGCDDFDAIQITGDALEPLIDVSFDVIRMPPVALPPTTILGTIKRLFLPRPVISPKNCIRCGRCVAICPLKPPAVSQKTTTHLPGYNYSTCIRCYCCQEVCPAHAITIHTPFIRQLLPFATYLSLLITRIRSKKKS